MRGTCAVIAMVLLVVLAAHMQREENQRVDDDPSVSLAAASSNDGCHASCPTPDDVDAAEVDGPATFAVADTDAPR